MNEREAFEAWLLGCGSADEISFEKLKAGDRVFDEYANKEVEAMWLAWKARAASADKQHDTAELKAPESDCPYCGGTGEADSGGIHPWGEPATIPCRCMYEDPFHVHVSAYNKIAAQQERNPMTEEQVYAMCDRLGLAQLSPLDLVAEVERHHGIKE